MKRSLGFWRTWALAVGTMIGSGVFLLPSVLAPYGSFSVLGWLLAGAGTLFIALTLAALAKRIPRVGGPYAYTREAFGDLAAFMVGWGYWISVWSAVAALAVAFSAYLAVFFPVFSQQPVYGALGSLAVIWLFTAVNLSGVRAAGSVQLVTTILKILPLLLIGIAGLSLGDIGGIPASNPNNEPLPMLFAAIVMLTMWAFVGVEVATVPADDVIEPKRTIPRALVMGTLTVTLVYVLATTGVMALIPPAQLAASSSPFADAAQVAFGSWGARLIAVGALISIVGSLNGNILVVGQMPRVIALDGLFPKVFGRLNANDAPGFAMVFSACLSSALIVMNYTKGLVAAFQVMILLSTLATLMPYAACAAAQLRIQYRENTAKVRWSSVVIALLAMLFSIFAIYGSGLDVAAQGLILLAAGLPVFFYVTRAGTR